MAAAAAQAVIKDDKAAHRQSTSELEAGLKESQAMFAANRQVCEKKFGIHHRQCCEGQVVWKYRPEDARVFCPAPVCSQARCCFPPATWLGTLFKNIAIFDLSDRLEREAAAVATRYLSQPGEP